MENGLEKITSGVYRARIRQYLYNNHEISLELETIKTKLELLERDHEENHAARSASRLK